MRALHGAAVAEAIALLTFSVTALTEGEGKPQPVAAAQNPADGWRGVVYPVYGWLPIYGADTKLPDVPGESSIDSNLDFVAGGTVMYLSSEGTTGRKSVKLDQTLYGPILGVGIPF